MARRNRAEFDAAQAETMSSGQIAAFLDERARRFAEAYNKSLNATEAAIAAGYKPGKNRASAAVQGNRLLRDGRVRAYRAALIRESAETMLITRESLQLKLMEIYERCMQKTPVMVYDSEKREYVESGEWQFDAKGATRALQQLSKMLGYDAPVKFETDGNSEIVVKLRAAGEYGD